MKTCDRCNNSEDDEFEVIQCLVGICGQFTPEILSKKRSIDLRCSLDLCFSCATVLSKRFNDAIVRDFSRQRLLKDWKKEQVE